MAYKVSVANGNWSTAGTWESVTNAPTLHATTNITIGTGTYYTLPFTAPNTTNACTGVMMYIASAGAGVGTVTITLQENNADTACAVSVLVTDLKSQWFYFRFPTPYVFTATTADYYRFKITRTTTTTSPTFAADAAGLNAMYLATDNRTGAPASTDDVFIVGNNGVNTVTVTVDGAQAIGSSQNDTVLPSIRTLLNALTVSRYGVLTWDIVTTSTLTVDGNITVGAGATFNMGTVANPAPEGVVCTLEMVEATTGHHGIQVDNTAVFTMQGVPKSSTSLWKTKYASGVGTAADPLITLDNVDWVVGDEIHISASSDDATNYNQTDRRYIITKNAANSYVVSLTKGGAEAALTYTHNTNAWILNVERNVILTSASGNNGWYLHHSNTTAGNIDIDWARFHTPYYTTTTTTRRAVNLYDAANETIDFDYSVISNKRSYGFYAATSKVVKTHTGIIICGPDASANAGFYQQAWRKTWVDCFAIGTVGAGFQPTAFNILTRCYAIGCNTGGTTTAGGIIGGGVGSYYDDCEIHCTRYGINMTVSVAGTFNNCLVGTKGKNIVGDVCVQTDNLFGALFNDCYFGSDTLVYNYLNGADGVDIKFHNLNATAMNHAFYTNYGWGRSTMAGLVDETVRTAGSMAYRFAPESDDPGFGWSFKILAKANSAVSVLGFIKKNTAMVNDTLTVNLYLPGSSTPDATMNMPNDEKWNVFSLAANYTGAVNQYATVEIIGFSLNSGAYFYVDDIYNGTNIITALDVCDKAKPSEIMFEQLGDAAAVWAVATSTLTTEGTIGKHVSKKLLTTSKFIGL